MGPITPVNTPSKDRTPPDEPTHHNSTTTVTQHALAALGDPVIRGLTYVGAASHLLHKTVGWVWQAVRRPSVRFGRRALYAQMVRLGVRAIGVVMLVNCCIGFILALQMAPPLQDFGQVEAVANIIAVAVFRELGPLICAIVLTGIGGAAIAAELGTMVVGEEIEALQVHALNPIRFLVMPRLLAAIVCMIILCVIAQLTAVTSGWWVSVTILGIPSRIYIENATSQLQLADFFTGLFKAGVFGLVVGLIACHNGLSVTGGASGVGRATTNTVVHSIVSIIFTDLIFTALFYRMGLT